MKTYIDRALIIPALTDRYEPEDARYQMTLTLAHIAEALLSIPIADVAEVRHGRWERILTASGIISRVRCSICVGTQPLTFENMSYCPNCGTRMDKENKHKVRCAKCRKIKEIVCTVDGKPWCEDCFDKAMGYGDQT